MQEQRVTVDVHPHELARPLLVLATQNPIEYEGTYPLPEAQVDRFMVRLSLGYPEPAGEAGMLAAHECRRSRRPAGAGRRRGRRARRAGRDDPRARLRAAAALHRRAARSHRAPTPRVELSASPRAGLLLLRAAKAHALVAGRDRAIPDDVQQKSQSVLAQRIVLAPDAYEDLRRAGRRRRGGGHASPVTSMRRALVTAMLAFALRADSRAARRRAAVGAGGDARWWSPPAAPPGSASVRAAYASRGRSAPGAWMEDEPVTIVLEVRAGRAWPAAVAGRRPAHAGARRATRRDWRNDRRARAHRGALRASRAPRAGPAAGCSSPTRSGSRRARSARCRRRWATRSSSCHGSSRSSPHRAEATRSGIARHGIPAVGTKVELDGIRPLRDGTPAGADLLARCRTRRRPAGALPVRRPAKAARWSSSTRAARRATRPSTPPSVPPPRWPGRSGRPAAAAFCCPATAAPVELGETLAGWAQLHARLALVGGGPRPPSLAWPHPATRADGVRQRAHARARCRRRSARPMARSGWSSCPASWPSPRRCSPSPGAAATS